MDRPRMGTFLFGTVLLAGVVVAPQTLLAGDRVIQLTRAISWGGEEHPHGDPFELHNIGLLGGTLYAKVSYAGGCGVHTFDRSRWSGFLESAPPQATVILVHDAGEDQCTDRIEEMLKIDVKPLRQAYVDSYHQEAGAIKLGVQAAGTRPPYLGILYEFPVRTMRGASFDTAKTFRGYVSKEEATVRKHRQNLQWAGGLVAGGVAGIIIGLVRSLGIRYFVAIGWVIATIQGIVIGLRSPVFGVLWLGATWTPVLGLWSSERWALRLSQVLSCVSIIVGGGFLTFVGLAVGIMATGGFPLEYAVAAAFGYPLFVGWPLFWLWYSSRPGIRAQFK